MLRSRLPLRALVALAAVTVFGCNSATSIPRETDPATIAYASSLDVDIKQMEMTPDGLYYKDITPGTGATVAAGDSIQAAYSLWLPNGTLVQQTTVLQPATIDLTRVIPGWQLGIPGMKEGGTRRLVIRPLLGYGFNSSGPIPPNSVLVFDVTVVKVL